MPVIDRNIINPDINYVGLNRDDLFSLINRWKRLLIVDYNVTKGDLVALAIVTVNANHTACLIALAELGAKLLLITKPICKETVAATKMGIFGPVDLTIAEDFYRDEENHMEMFLRFSKQICWESDIDRVTNDNDVTLPYSVDPTDTFIFASTSGTTGQSSPVLFSHEETYKISERSIKIFKLYKDSVVQHTTNMHHVSSMLTEIIPSLMVVDTHYFGGIAPFELGFKRITPEEFVTKRLVENGVDRIMTPLVTVIDWIVEEIRNHNIVLNKKLIINISGFTVPEYMYDMCKQYPIELISHYGAVDVGVAMLINTVDENSVYEEHSLGVQPDDGYNIIFGDDDILVQSKFWEGTRILPDHLEEKNGVFYHIRRRDTGKFSYPEEIFDLVKEQLGEYSFVVLKNSSPCLVVWNTNKVDYDEYILNKHMFDPIVFLNKEDFMVDTKVSMEQLRAYLEHHYG